MRKHSFILLISISSIVLCSKPGSKTPQEALITARSAYLNKDTKTFLSTLSQGALSKMEENLETMRKAFAKVPDHAQVEIAEKMGFKTRSLSKLTLTEYLDYLMNNEQGGMGSDNILFPVDVVKAEDVVESSNDNSSASMTFQNGGKMEFIYEKDSWKIHSYLFPEVPEDDTNEIKE